MLGLFHGGHSISYGCWRKMIEFTIFWLMTGAFICRASYIAEKSPVWRLYHEIMTAYLIEDRRELFISLLTLMVFVVMWPLTLYYFVMQDGDW